MTSPLDVTRNPYELSLLLDIPFKDAVSMLSDPHLPYLPGWGKVRMQKYILSRKRAGTPWPKQDTRIRFPEHRIKHDAGEVTMCQGRDGDWVIQYSIPKKNRKPIEPYFSREEIY